MLNRLWIWSGREAAGPGVADLFSALMRVDARSRVAVMVLALGPRLRGRLGSQVSENCGRRGVTDSDLLNQQLDRNAIHG